MSSAPPSSTPAQPQKKRHKFRGLLKKLFLALLFLIALGAIGRLMLPSYARWYVNRTLDKSPVYKGTIGNIDINLLQGGYVIHDIQLTKITGNVPVPFFTAKHLDLHLEWAALLHGKLVGQIAMMKPLGKRREPAAPGFHLASRFWQVRLAALKPMCVLFWQR